MSYQTIAVGNADSISRIVLNRPDKLNSLTEVMLKELNDAIRKAHSDSSIRCVLLTGSGRAFCAGQDLTDAENNRGEFEVKRLLEEYYNPLVKMICGMDKPVVCAVNGVAAGAGANIALACDIVLAARSAKFIQAFSKIALVPDAGGTWMLPRLIGHARAVSCAMLGEAVSAEQAENWGMIHQCLDDEQLIQSAEDMARHLANQATTCLAYTKKLMQLSWQNTLSAQLDLEAAFQDAASRTADCREGVDAFRGKRPATFQGR